MTDEIDERAMKLRDMVVTVMDAVSRTPAGQMGGTAADAQLMLHASHYITAAMLEARPETETPAKLRLAGEAHAKNMHAIMKEQRSRFERTGARPRGM